MQIDFVWPEIQHPKGEVSVLELARILESKYHIVENFCSYIMEDFQKRSLPKILKNGKEAFVAEQEWLKNEWRQYIIGGKTGVQTNAALFRGDQSFIDTSAYYLSMQPYFKLDKVDKVLIGLLS